ncbi:MAG: pyruvate kinase [Spirochaetaceae bacterium]|nr:MAG: pyruvate kinase [Spirochaetaceae bacterium]
MRRTKIVCTLGPAVDSDDGVRALIRAGMNVARFNFSHGTHDEHRERLQRLRSIAHAEHAPVATLLDTKGPEIRTGRLRGDATVELEAGDTIILTTEQIDGDSHRVSVSYRLLADEVGTGNHIYVADGLIDLEVTSVDPPDVTCVVRSGGTLGSRKNVNIPGVRVQLPAITDKDRADILFAIEQQMDFIAASFVRKASDVDQIQQILRERESSIRVIAKIEDQEGLDAIDDIARISDGVMIARGDLGVQLAIEEIPLAQKRIIAICNALSKPVITATQMLDSMIANPRPTRAELTDVANAIFDGTDAVMLSGETAVGAYPARACDTLDRIARTVERSPEYQASALGRIRVTDESDDIGSALAKATIIVAADINAAAIIAPTLRGNSPRMLCRYRPAQTIVAVTTTEAVQRQLALHWGIVPVLAEEVGESDVMIHNAIRQAIALKLIKPSDRVVTCAGVPLRSPIPMNSIKVHILGNILNRGHDGFGTQVTGRIVKAATPDEAHRRLRSDRRDILLVPVLGDEHRELIAELAGLVVEERSQLSHDTIRELNADLVMITEVPDAMRSIEDGTTVTLDGEEKILYEGVL